MGYDNLATVIGPNVLRTKSGGQQVELCDSVKVTLLMKLMIQQRKAIGQVLKSITEKFQEEVRLKQVAKAELFQVALQRSNLDDNLLDPTKINAEKKKGSRRNTLTRQLSKRSQGARRASTTSVSALWSTGKFVQAPHSVPTNVVPSARLLTEREKRVVALPPPKGEFRTMQELEEILLQETQRRLELEDMLNTEIAARQELDKRLSEFLTSLKDASRLLADPKQ